MYNFSVQEHKLTLSTMKLMDTKERKKKGNKIALHIYAFFFLQLP